MAIFNMNDSSLNSYLNEADSQYKHTKSTYKNGGYNVYSKSDLSNNDNDSLKRSLYYSAKDAHRAKKDRGSHEGAQDYTPNQRITNSNNKPVSTARLNANNIAKELRKRGVSQSEINSEINDARKSSQKEFNRQALHARQKNGPSISDKVAGNAGINKSVIKDRLKAKGKLKEAAEYIYSMIESAEYYENHDEVNTSLREAAEYILAVLDESEKNKDLNNTFKNVVKSKVKELYDKGKVVDIDSLPDSDIKDKIKNRLNK